MGRKFHRAFRITRQGVYLSGENNSFARMLRRETKKDAAFGEILGVKVPLVTWVRPETRRSRPGQGEARVKPRGGLQGYCEQAFL